MPVIYVLTDPRTGIVRYVGKTSREDLDLRLKEHLAEAKAEDHYRARWIRKLLSLGLKPGIRMLVRVDESEVNEAERALIAHYRQKHTGKLTNGTDGGEGVFLTPEILTKRNASMQRRYANGLQGPFTGKKHTKEALKKMSEATKGKKHTEETRKKMSDAAKGRKNPMLDRKHTKEARKKMSEVAKASWSDPERRKAGIAHLLRVSQTRRATKQSFANKTGHKTSRDTKFQFLGSSIW